MRSAGVIAVWVRAGACFGGSAVCALACAVSATNAPRTTNRPTACMGLSPNERREGKRSEEHTSELQSLTNLVCRLLLEKKKKKRKTNVMDEKEIIKALKAATIAIRIADLVNDPERRQGEECRIAHCAEECWSDLAGESY